MSNNKEHTNAEIQVAERVLADAKRDGNQETINAATAEVARLKKEAKELAEA